MNENRDVTSFLVSRLNQVLQYISYRRSTFRHLLRKCHTLSEKISADKTLSDRGNQEIQLLEKANKLMKYTISGKKRKTYSFSMSKFTCFQFVQQHLQLSWKFASSTLNKIIKILLDKILEFGLKKACIASRGV